MKLKKWNNTLVYLHQIVPVRDYPRKVASTRKETKVAFMIWKTVMENVVKKNEILRIHQTIWR